MTRYVLHESGQKGAENPKVIVKKINESLHGLVGERAVSGGFPLGRLPG